MQFVGLLYVGLMRLGQQTATGLPGQVRTVNVALFLPSNSCAITAAFGPVHGPVCALALWRAVLRTPASAAHVHGDQGIDGPLKLLHLRRRGTTASDSSGRGRYKRLSPAFQSGARECVNNLL